MPAFCPRIRLEITESALDGEREAGRGSSGAGSGHLQLLQKSGAEHVTLDWYTGDLEKTRDHAHGWQMLATLADQVLDLDKESLR